MRGAGAAGRQQRGSRGERGLSLAGSGQEQRRFGELSQQRREADVKTQQKR